MDAIRCILTAPAACVNISQHVSSDYDAISGWSLEVGSSIAVLVLTDSNNFESESSIICVE